MKNVNVVCVDFGSAYTKVAARTGWDDESKLIDRAPAAVEDPSFCIPSVVARADRPTGVRWAIGKDAASATEGPKLKVYRHWKADLFPTGQPQGHGTATIGGTAFDIGVQFFQRLKQVIHSAPGFAHVRDYPVRVCVPHLGGSERAEAAVMSRLLTEAGWKGAETRPIISEPESNVCGVFTRGQNFTWIPRRPAARGRTAFYRNMFEPRGLLRSFQAAATGGRDITYGVLVTDIGAFTTDFGYVKFDQSFYDDDAPRPDVVQQSYRVGVAELDDAVQSRFSGKFREALARTTPLDWETIKKLLYSGNEAAVAAPAGRLILGRGGQKQVVSEEIEAFVSRVLTAMNEFRTRLGSGNINAHVVTGGGSFIPSLRQQIMRAVKDRGSLVYDLLDEAEPQQVLTASFDSQTGAPVFDQRAVERRIRDNRSLIRAGSALGGASVYFE